MQPREMLAAAARTLKNYLKSRGDDVASVDAVYTETIDSLHSFVFNGGKHVCPTFAWQGWLGAGGLESHFSPAEDSPAVMNAISALELTQACALVHDDIIDSADMYRGASTIHKVFEAKYEANSWDGAADRFGISTAILIGGVALTWVDDTMHSSGPSSEALARALVPWWAMCTEALGGQLLDITAEANRYNRVETAEKINLFKTAAYTIGQPLHIGVAIAGVPAELVGVYRSFGRDIDVAFQLRDGQLDIFGDPEVTGKPADDNLREGKRTVPVGQALSLYRESTPEKARFIDERLGAVLSAADIDELRNPIADSGAADIVEREIDRLVSRAFSTTEDADLPAASRGDLIAMGVCATVRQHWTRCCAVMPTASPTHAPSNSPRLRRVVTRPHKGAKPRLTIIGAGLSGLTATPYAITDGYDVTVVERESFVGGRCASEPVTVDVDEQTLTVVFNTDATV